MWRYLVEKIHVTESNREREWEINNILLWELHLMTSLSLSEFHTNTYYYLVHYQNEKVFTGALTKWKIMTPDEWSRPCHFLSHSLSFAPCKMLLHRCLIAAERARAHAKEVSNRKIIISNKHNVTILIKWIINWIVFFFYVGILPFLAVLFGNCDIIHEISNAHCACALNDCTQDGWDRVK